MTKTFCDRCGDELTHSLDTLFVQAKPGTETLTTVPTYDLCQTCSEEARAFMQGKPITRNVEGRREENARVRIPTPPTPSRP
jgi:hypothetical protein